MPKTNIPLYINFVILLAVVFGAAGFAPAQTGETPPPYVFSHLAGPAGGYGNADGTGINARFWNPTGLALDSAGNIYVADTWNRSVRRITPAGVVTTVLTTAEASQVIPSSGYYESFTFYGVAVDAADNLFVSQSDGAIFKRTPAGALSHYTGKTGLKIYTSTDGTLAEATFSYPTGLTFDPAGNLYVADPDNQIIRKITPQGIVSTFAGTAPAYGHPQGAGPSRRRMFPGSTDGPALSAQFYLPTAVASDVAGNLYVADSENRTVRKVSPDGQVTTLAGKAGLEGSSDGLGEAARFSRIAGVAADLAGNVYVADSENGTIRKITPAGLVTTLAGSAGDRRTVDGPGATARFVAPRGLLFDRSRNRLLVGDGSSYDKTLDRSGTIRAVTLDGMVTTLVGLGGGYGTTDAKGEAARFKNPTDVAVDANGVVFVADSLNHTIRRITPDGVVTTLAGNPGVAGSADGAGNTARFNRPVALALDSSGSLIVVDQDNHLIRKVSPTGTVTTLAGKAGVIGAADGIGTTATFRYPVSVAVDGTGNIYVGDGDFYPAAGDPARQYGTIRKITPAGTVTTLAGNPEIVSYKQTRPDFDGTGANARFGNPTGITIDPDGNLYVADNSYRRIRKVTPQGVVSSLNLVDANGAEFSIRAPVGITRDRHGNLFVAENTANRFAGPPDSRILRITPAGITTAVAGPAGVLGSKNGLGLDAQFNQPAGIEIDGSDTLYVADTENHAIRKAVLGGPPAISTQPQSQTVVAGGTVQFSITATGIPAPTYQWFHNGNPFSGATASTLSFTNARSSDAGEYTVVVTNPLGSVTSATATLTVTAAPATPPPATGGGGGGGAPSLWFIGSLGLLGLGRVLRRQPAR
jgi:sugar lactone lactonase YvrE